MFSGVSRWRLATLFLAAFHTCSVGPKVGGVRGHVDGRDALQSLTRGIKIVQSLGVVEPGVVQDHRDLLPLIGLARQATHHEGGLLGVLVSLDGVDPHLLGRQAQCPEERPAHLLTVHVQPCPPPPGEGRVRRVSASWRARTSSTAPGLPSALEQIVDLAPDLGHPPGDGLLVAAPLERVGELEAHAQKAHEQPIGGLGPVLDAGA